MGKEAFRILEGIVLAAEQLAERANIGLLRKDARQLTIRCGQQGLLPDAGHEAMVGKIKVADAWVKYRRRRPSGELEYEVIGVIKQHPKETERVSIEAGVFRIEETGNVLQDDQFAELFAGAQVGLKGFAGGLSKDILTQDWEEIPQLYPQLLAHYAANGVPLDGARVLVTQEYINFRLSNPLGSLLRGPTVFGKEERYGWLEVYTEPTAANVWVDDDDWGESPAKKGVPSGEHHVKAKKEERQAEDDVDVEPGGSERVDLELS